MVVDNNIISDTLDIGGVKQMLEEVMDYVFR